MSSRYSSGVVLVQASSRPSSSSTYSSSYAPSTFSMDSSSASQSTIEARYRSGSSASFYTNVKEIPSSRGGSSVVVVHHNCPNPDKDEPRSSDYQYSGSSRRQK